MSCVENLIGGSPAGFSAKEPLLSALGTGQIFRHVAESQTWLYLCRSHAS